VAQVSSAAPQPPLAAAAAAAASSPFSAANRSPVSCNEQKDYNYMIYCTLENVISMTGFNIFLRIQKAVLKVSNS
jgi:hypothetical protein